MEETLMSTRINTNVTALQAAANLNTNSANLAGNIERLSSGLRINSAADDPAGLAISENFKAQISGLNQATSNSNDAINEVKTAEGALNQVQSLLISIRQLAVHASNLGPNSTVDLQADQTQINSAIASINQIAATTSFGNKLLLNGSANSGSTTTAGTTTGTGVTVSAPGLFNAAQAGTYTNLSVTAATAATDTVAFSGGTLTSGASGNYSGALTINGVQYSLNTSSASSLSELNSAITSSGYQASINSSNELTFTNQSTGALASPAQINISDLTVGSSSAVAATSTAIAGTAGTVTLAAGTAALDSTIANDTVATSGSLVFSLNGGSNITASLTAGTTLSAVNTQLNAYGVTLGVASNAIDIHGTGSISVSSLSSTVASTTLNTIGTAAGATSLTITPSGLGALDTNAANNTFTQTGTLVLTDAHGAGSTNTITATAGETSAAFITAVNTADSQITGSVNASGGLVLTGDGTHNITATTATNLTLGDTGESLGAISAAAGTAAGYSFAQTGNSTLTTASALFTGVLTVSGAGSSSQILTVGPNTTLAQLNNSLTAAGVAATVGASGSLKFVSTTGLAAPTVTLGANFSAYENLTPSSTSGTFSNGSNASLTISNGSNTLTSTSTQAAGGTNYYNFDNGLVVASTVSSGSIVGNVTSTAGTTTAGQALEFQIGANGGQTAEINIASVAANLLGNGAASYVDANGTSQTVQTDSIADLNVLTFKGAQDAISVIDKAVNDLSTARANLGAFQTNVLQSNVNTLSVASQNLSSSLSTIEDTNLSTEIVDYTKNQILVQAGTSALGQANQAPQAILKLLQ
jgi:flagellin